MEQLVDEGWGDVNVDDMGVLMAGLVTDSPVEELVCAWYPNCYTSYIRKLDLIFFHVGRANKSICIGHSLVRRYNISSAVAYFGISFVLSVPCVAPLSLGLTHGNLMKCELGEDGTGGWSATSGSTTCRCSWIFCRWGVSLPFLTSG